MSDSIPRFKRLNELALQASSAAQQLQRETARLAAEHHNLPEQGEVYPLAPGDTVGSGGMARVLAVVHQPSGRHVLAEKTDAKATCPYVTWAVDDDGNVYWGRYFSHLESARRDFAARVALMAQVGPADIP